MAAKMGSVAATLVLLSLIGAAWAGRPSLEEALPEGEEIGKAISGTEPWIQKLRRLLSASGGDPSYGSGGDYSPYGGGSPSGYYGTPSTARSESRANGPNGYNYGAPSGPAPVSGGSGGGCRRGDVSQQGIIDCTNAMRANPSLSRCGGGLRPVGPLRADPSLMQAAQGHSVAQDRARQMSHSLGGSTMSSRIRASGYRGRAYAENVAAGQRDSYDVVESWMCSSGHRKNMMSCNYADIGVGVSCSSGRCYWTQNFGCQGSCNCQGGGNSPPLPGGGVPVPGGSSGGYPGGYPGGSSGGYPGGSSGGYPGGSSGGYPGGSSGGYPGGSSGGYPGGSSGGYPGSSSGGYPGGSSGGYPGRPSSSGSGYPGYYTGRPTSGGSGHPSHSGSIPSSGGSGHPGYYTGSPSSGGSGFPYYSGGSPSSGGSGSPYHTGGSPSGDSGSGEYPWGYPTPKGNSGDGFHIPGAGSGSGGYGYPGMPKAPSSTSGGDNDGFYGPSSAKTVVTSGMGKVNTDAYASGYGKADGKGESDESSASAYATAYAMG